MSCQTHAHVHGDAGLSNCEISTTGVLEFLTWEMHIIFTHPLGSPTVKAAGIWEYQIISPILVDRQKLGCSRTVIEGMRDTFIAKEPAVDTALV
jgi:hypothetical protein